MIWSLRKRLWLRQLRQTWQQWRASGLLLMGGYLGAFGVVLLVSAWESYRVALAVPAPQLVAAVAGVWWLSAWLVNRPSFGVNPTDELMLRMPVPPRKVLVWPLLSRLWPSLAISLGLALLLVFWWPHWWTVALTLPPLTAGRFLLQTVVHDARLCGRPLGVPALLSFLPLTGSVHAVVLPLSLLAACFLLAWWWWQGWPDTVPPQALRRWQVEGLRHAGRQLGLPTPDMGPDGVPAPRWLKLRLRGRGPFSAMCWRSSLHLVRRRRRLLLSALLMPLVGLGIALLASPPADLDLMLLRGMPLLLAQGWAFLLALVGPPSPEAWPPVFVKLARALPAGLWLGSWSALGAALSSASWSTGVAAFLLPVTALSLLIWLGRATPGSPSNGQTLRWSAAAFPLLLVLLCGTVLGGWLAPLLMLAVCVPIVGWPRER